MKHGTRLAVTGLILSQSFGPAAVVAQEPHPLEVGDRIRVQTVLGSDRFRGSVISIEPGGFQFRQGDGGLRSLTHEDIYRLERSLGRRSYAGRGALIGGLVGFGLGAALGIALVDGLCEVDSCANDYPGAIAVVGGVFGAGGAGLGAIFGLIASGERWEELALDRQQTSLDLRLSATSGGSASLGLTIRP